MSLSKKTFIIIITTIIGLMVVMYLISRLILLVSFEKLENEKVLKNIQIAYDALIGNIENFNRSNGDWAIWDDTYRFIDNPNQKYIEENLPVKSLTNLKINYIFFINKRGDLIYSKGVSLIENKEVSIPSELANFIRKDSLLKHHENDESSIKGIVMISNLPMLVTSRPVIHSSGKGPYNGIIIMLRILDSIEILNLSKLAHIPIKIDIYKNFSGSDSMHVSHSISEPLKFL
jgi:adenylate cyclase